MSTSPCSTIPSLLACPICLEVCIPPIYQCRNGHIICSSCLRKVKICGICRIKLEEPQISCLALETLAEETDAPCKFAQDGCPVIVKLANLTSHGLDCPFGRSLICDHLLDWQPKCHDLVRLDPGSIIMHLTEAHGGVVIQMANAVTINQIVQCGRPQRFPPICLAYDGQVFVVRTTASKLDKSISWKVFLVRSCEAAKNYKAQLTLYGGGGENLPVLTWTGPVLGLDVTDALPVANQFFQISEKTMGSYVKVVNADTGINKSWFLSIAICNAAAEPIQHFHPVDKQGSVVEVVATSLSQSPRFRSLLDPHSLIEILGAEAIVPVPGVAGAPGSLCILSSTREWREDVDAIRRRHALLKERHRNPHLTPGPGEVVPPQTHVASVRNNLFRFGSSPSTSTYNSSGICGNCGTFGSFPHFKCPVPTCSFYGCKSCEKWHGHPHNSRYNY